MQPTCQPNLHNTNIEVVVNCKSLNFIIQLFVKLTKCDECKLGWQVPMRMTYYPWGKVSNITYTASCEIFQFYISACLSMI